MKKILVIALIWVSATAGMSQEKMQPSLNHIAIYVQDLKSSDHFYQDFLKLEVIPEPFKDGKHTWYKIGPNAALHVIEGAKVQNQNDRNSHLCFRVDNINSIIAEIQRRKIPYVDAAGKSQSVTIRPDGVKQIYIQDPDGFWIEINDDK